MANTEYLSVFNYNLVNHRRMRNKILFWSIIEFFSFLIYFLINNILIPFLIILISTFLIKEFYLSPIKKSYKSGYLGEKKTLKMLKKLPKSYIIFNQIEIPSEQSSYNEYETDFIILGPNCLFIVETKSYYGKIFCENEHQDWIRKQFDKHGLLISSDLVKSPFLQVQKQSKSLVKFLIKFDIHLNAHLLVFLNMNRKDYKLPKNSSIPVFNNKKIVKYIKNIDRTETTFKSDNDKEKIFEILKELNKDSILSRKNRLRDKKHLRGFLIG